MSDTELRRDLVSGNHVLVNPARSGRPFTVDRHAGPGPNRAGEPALDLTGTAAREACPFCWGNEAATAQELARTGAGEPGTPGWNVRVVRNRYPVVGGTDAGTGRCEVVVFRAHDRRLEDMEVDEVAEILGVLRDRLATPALAHLPSTQVFVNVEAAAGASVAHPHAQIIGLDFVPPALELEFAVIAAAGGADPLARDLALARDRDLLVVDGAVAAWCPWGMPYPFAVRIAPSAPDPGFAGLGSAALRPVAQTLRDVLRAVNDLLGRPAYNVVLFADREHDGLVRRWRLDIVPRINVGGGFEIGTGVTTHSTATDEAARALRSVLGRSPAPVPAPDQERLAL